MKYFIITLALIISIPSFAQKKQIREVDTFTEISYRVPGKLYLRQGTPQKVELEGNGDVLERIETEVKSRRLVIGDESRNSWFSWGSSSDRINVYITVENIDGLYVAGSGDLIAETKIKASDLDLKVSGSGSLRAEVDVTANLEASVSGSGELKVKGNCGSIEAHVSGSGDVIIANAIDGNADFSISGSGKIVAVGKSQSVKARISGSGKLLAADLQTDRCDVSIAGSGDVEINVVSELDARISGSGSVAYKGEPKHVNSRASGSGKVRKL